MITISKEKLKDEMSEYLRRVEEDGEELIVTNDSVPVIRISALARSGQTVDEAFADLRGKIEYHGNILESEIEEWGDV